MSLPRLTLLLGPPTRTAQLLNTLVRAHRVSLDDAGLRAVPSRVATPALRAAAIDNLSADRRAEALTQITGGGPALVSALGFFGPPSAGLSGREMLPDIEPLLAGLAEALSDEAALRIVLTPDTLPRFFMSYASEGLNARVRATAWDVLYELNWADLVQEVVLAFPTAEVIVLTPMGAAKQSPEVQSLLFAPAERILPMRYLLLHGVLTITGQAVLRPLVANAKAPDAELLTDLYHSFEAGPVPADIQDALGLDHLTVTLLDQRFDEDIARISAMPGVRVI